MAEYRISGVWKNVSGVITHYRFHTYNPSENTATRMVKTSKTNVISIIENMDNLVITWVWNYESSGWFDGENVEVVNGANGKYLRSNPDKIETNNLEHLINYDWIKP